MFTSGIPATIMKSSQRLRKQLGGAYTFLREEGWKDIKKAILHFEKAAEDGNSFSEYQLGKIYYFGNGIRADSAKGLDYLKASAAHGNEYAANLLQVIQHQQTVGAANCAASLIAQLGRIFQEQEQKQTQRQSQRMDGNTAEKSKKRNRLWDFGIKKKETDGLLLGHYFATYRCLELLGFSGSVSWSFPASTSG